jgi:PPOX class probable FMN-dependent enzyme
LKQPMTPEKLREIYGPVVPRAAVKDITRFDKHCRQFIEHSPFVLIATSDGSNLDLSPKGDPAGFVTVESDTILLIPDRLGNNRIDGLLNILEHPKVALLFLIPTVTETLRVNGRAEITDDPNICKQFEYNGKIPLTVIRVHAEQIFTHCGKAPLRAGLWKPETWLSARPVATLGEIIRDHTGLHVDSIEQSAVDELYRDTLY